MGFRHRSVSWTAALYALGGTMGVLFASPVAAQSVGADGPSVSVHAGASQFDLSGTGTAPVFALRAAFPLNSVIRVEGSVGLSRPEQQFQADPTSLWTPELQVQFSVPGQVSPFLGVGGGVAFETGRDSGFDPGTRVTASASGGVRVQVADRWGLIGELRVRGIGDAFQGSAAEWTVGVSRRF